MARDSMFGYHDCCGCPRARGHWEGCAAVYTNWRVDCPDCVASKIGCDKHFAKVKP